MIKVYDENLFFKTIQIGDSFTPKSFSFVIVYQGSITIELNNFSNTYNKGNVIVFSPNDIYKAEHFGKGLKVYIISMDRQEMHQKISLNFNRYDAYRIANIEKNKSILNFGKREFENLCNNAEQIAYYLQQDNNYPFREELLINLYSTILYAIVGAMMGNERGIVTTSRKEEVTLRFIELVVENFRKQRNLAFYADKLNISIKYLSNCVRDTTKVPPTKILADAIVNYAKILLLNRNNSINQISGDLGFIDQFVFGKFFKKHTGYSPKYFRNQNELVETI